MAVDDAQIGFTTGVASGGTRDVQPASGDEYLVHRIASDQTSGGSAPNIIPDTSAVIYNGTNGSNLTRTAGTPENGAALTRVPMHLHMTNSYYLRTHNDGASSGILGHTATETK